MSRPPSPDADADADADLEADRRGSSVYDRIRPAGANPALRELLQLIREGASLVWAVDRRVAALALGAQLLVSLGLVAQLLVARRVLSVLVKSGESHPQIDAVLLPVAVLAGLVALVSFAETVSTELTRLLGELVGRCAAEQILEVATTVELDSFERPEFFNRLDRAGFNAGARNLALANSIVSMAGAATATAGVALTLLTIDPLLVALLVAAAPAAWLAAARNSRALHELQQRLTPLDRLRTYLFGALSWREQSKEVRAFDLGPELSARHHDLYTRRIAAVQEVVKTSLRRALTADLLRALAIAGTLGVLLWQLDSDRVSLAQAGVALLALLLLAQRLRAALQAVGQLYESALFLEDVRDFRALKPAAPPAGVSAPVRFEKLSVVNLGFTYPGRRQPVLQDVDLTVRSGEIVALVGENGSGKTTLAKLLAALYEPTSGYVAWDGRDIREFDRRELRERIAVLFQDFVRWHLSARDNVGLGRVGRLRDEDGVEVAATQAEADPFLTSLPSGYGTILSRLFPGGYDLSGGQWQRVALARTLFRDAPFVVLDEPAAALDAVAEAHLFQALRDLLRGRAGLFVSHRFSSVRLADRIYVLHAGRVVEHGSHGELLALGGRYARMFSLQASAYLDDRPAG